MLLQIIAIVACYFIGAIPFGLLFSRHYSMVDIRTVGSGNIGATNVLRTAGKKAAILTLIADCLKGLLPVITVRILFHQEELAVLTGIAAILGHNFPVYIRFRGGKGVATSFGVVLALSAATGFVCLIAWALAAYIWRYSSLSALCAFAIYPLIVFSIQPVSVPHAFFSLFTFSMIYFRHRENIRRLLAGTEPKIGVK